MAAAKTYLRSFLFSLLVCATGTIGVATAIQDELPAPRLSDSVSFNEKAKWLRKNLGGHKCDVVILGSSIALNDPYVPIISQNGKYKVVNAGSWGLSIDEDEILFMRMISICSPGVAIIPVYFGDFSRSSDKNIDWKTFAYYANGDYSLVAFFGLLDSLSHLRKVLEYRDRQRRGRTFYESLLFDDSGTVNFDCEGFHVDPTRWDFFSREQKPIIRDAALRAMANIANLAKQHHVRLVVAAAPMRAVGERSFYPEVLEELWGRVAAIVTAAGGQFVHIRTVDGFDDSLFVDYLHLNECGARRWSDVLLSRVGQLP